MAYRPIIYQRFTNIQGKNMPNHDKLCHDSQKMTSKNRSQKTWQNAVKSGISWHSKERKNRW